MIDNGEGGTSHGPLRSRVLAPDAGHALAPGERVPGICFNERTVALAQDGLRRIVIANGFFAACAPVANALNASMTFVTAKSRGAVVNS